MDATKRRRSLLKLVVLLAFIAGAVYFFRFTETGQSITPTAVLEYFDSLDPLWARLLDRKSVV